MINPRVGWTRWRRSSQVAFVVFFILLPVTYRWGQTAIMGSLSSLKIGAISLVDPASGFAAMIASREVGWSLVSGMVLPVLLAFVLGPVFCSWVCPWGFLSELLHRRVLRSRPQKTPRWVPHLRWSFLGAIAILGLATGTPLAATLSAPRLITMLPMEIVFLGGASAGTLGLLGMLLVLEILLPRRLWCRALCPVGSVLVLLGFRRTLTVAWTESTCRPEKEGPQCVRSCPWSLDPRHLQPYDGCTNCGGCIEVCPSGPSLRYSISTE